jgi:hypothetical protein
VPDVGTSRPGSIEPGSPEALRQVAAHEQGVRDLQELRRLEAEREWASTPEGRIVRALESIADSLREILRARG